MARRDGNDGGGAADGRGPGNAAAVVVNRVSTDALRHLPRTTRWRVQLGLLDLPGPIPPPGAADDGASNPLGGDRGCVDTGGPTGPKTAVVADGRGPTSEAAGNSAAAAAFVTECEIYECSASKLAQQRDRFDRLARDHMWRNSPLDLIEQEKKNDPSPPDRKSEPKETSSPAPAPSSAPVVDDPLSAFVREREEAERAEAAAAAEAEAEEEATRGRIETHNGEEGGRRSSQWTGFYSNREVIDLINKDLHRLSPRLVLPPPQQPRNTKSPSRTSSAGGLSSFCASSSDDEDDLDDDDSARMGRDFRKLAGPAWERRREERLRLLSDVLFLYSMEHPDVGYRQGMHEVLAHVVLALEMDMMNTSDDNDGRRGGGASSDAGGDFVVVPRLHRASSSASASSSSPHTATTADLRMDAYLLFEAWMDHLKPAYMDDHASRSSGGGGGGGGNAAAIGDRVLELLRHESPHVHSVISDIGTRMGAPPQLYLVGWMRLLFGRVFSDVAGTLDMWDCLLDLLADPPRWSDEEEVGGGRNGDGDGQRDNDNHPPPRRLSLMDILECAACGMILLQAPSLLSDGGGGGAGDDFDDPDDDGGVSSTMRMHDRLSLLMNYPTLSDVGELRDLTVITARDRLERRSRRWRRRRARSQRRGGGDGGRSSPAQDTTSKADVPGEISVMDARVAASAAAAAAISSGVHHQRTQPTAAAPPLGAVVVGCPEDDYRPRSSPPPPSRPGFDRHPPQPPPERQGHRGRVVAGIGTGANGRRNRQRQQQQQQQQQQHWDSGVALSSRVGEALDRTVVSCRGFIAKAEGRISQEIANMEGRIKSHEAAAGNNASLPVPPHGSSTSPITGNVSVGFHQGGNYNSASSPLGDGGASSALSPHQTATADKDEQQQHHQRRQDELMQRSKLRERLHDISNGMDDGLRAIRDNLMLLSNRPGGGGTGRPLENGGAGSSSDSPTGGNIDSSSTTNAFETIPLHPSESQQQRLSPGEGVLEALRRLEALQRELASLGEELE